LPCSEAFSRSLPKPCSEDLRLSSAIVESWGKYFKTLEMFEWCLMRLLECVDADGEEKKDSQGKIGSLYTHFLVASYLEKLELSSVMTQML
jgi:hypothetical protein